MRLHLVNSKNGHGALGAINLTPAQIYQTARNAGFPESTAKQMTAISLRETGGTGNPNAYYGGTAAHPEASYGLWQINWNDPGVRAKAQSVGVTDPEQLTDPAVNAAVAYALWGGNDNNLNVAWYINKGGVYTAGYEKWLPVAEQAAGEAVGESIPTPLSTDVFTDNSGVSDDESGGADTSMLVWVAAAWVGGVVVMSAVSR